MLCCVHFMNASPVFTLLVVLLWLPSPGINCYLLHFLQQLITDVICLLFGVTRWCTVGLLEVVAAGAQQSWVKIPCWFITHQSVDVCSSEGETFMHDRLASASLYLHVQNVCWCVYIWLNTCWTHTVPWWIVHDISLTPSLAACSQYWPHLKCMTLGLILLSDAIK